MSRLILGLAGCAGVAAWGSQGCGVGQIHSFPRSRKQPLLPALASSLCLGLGPSGRGQLVSLLSFALGRPCRSDGTQDHAVQSSARAESAPRHRQGWSLSLSTEELSTLQSCGPRAGLGAQHRRVGVGGLLILPGDRAHNRLGSPLAFPKAHAAPWMCPVQGGWGLCALPSSPQALICSDKEAATHWCLLVTTVGYFWGGKRICI